MSAPIVVVHRRNKAEMLAGLPSGAWVEIDIDLLNGVPVLSHDTIVSTAPPPEKLADFLPQALRRGVAGFIFDCKRENMETRVAPLIAEHKIENYFYINEMEILGDMELANESSHKTAVRIWQYRGARDLIRYAQDMRSAKQNGPGWAWVDCWHRALPDDFTKAFIPLTQTDGRNLQQLGVKLCLCSPELYVHDYKKTYKADELEAMYRGVVQFRRLLMHAGIRHDAVCTKFPWLWSMDVDLLAAARSLSGTVKAED